MAETDNRLAIGGNNPPTWARMMSAEPGDFALIVTAFLEEEFGKHRTIVQALLDEARALPNPIANDDDRSKYTSLIKRIRDERKVLVAIHEKEKLGYWRGGQACDQFAFGMIDKLERRDKKAQAGANDVLGNRLTDYDTRILAEKQAALQREADERERVAKEARDKADKEAREAEEAELAAKRARKPETKVEKQEAAEVKTLGASAAAVTANIAAQQAEAAHVATLARPADLMRQRGDDGTLSTMATETYSQIEDDTKLDMAKLWPFISLDAKQKALNAWAKTTGHNTQMAGALIGRKPKSKVL